MRWQNDTMFFKKIAFNKLKNKGLIKRRFSETLCKSLILLLAFVSVPLLLKPIDRLISHIPVKGFKFEITCFDDLYGRSEWLRSQLRGEELLYMADIPCTTHVYLKEPELGVPEKESEKRGKEPTKVKVLSPEKPQTVSSLAIANDTQWQKLCIRTCDSLNLKQLFTERKPEKDWQSFSGFFPGGIGEILL